MPFGGYRLDVVDRGKGMRMEDVPRGTGLGTRLVRMMAAKINATFAWQDAVPGTRFTLYGD
jgi:signal transduction histidine kinase